MSRHSRNNTAHSIFTYHERKLLKDVGTIKERLGSDSQRQFEQCWLCLQTAIKPMCTPKGYVYCRQCIMLNFGEQKRQNEDQSIAYHLNEIKTLKETQEKEESKEKEKIRKFVESEGGGVIIDKTTTTQQQDQNVKNKFASLDRKESKSKNFWIAENTPSAAALPPPPPKKGLRCPLSGDSLRLRDLVEIKPEILSSGDVTVQWVCAISKKLIKHQSAAVIKPTGQIVLEEYVDKYVLGRKGFCNRDICRSDIIPMISGGTGFCAHNKVEAERFRPALR
eukprot:GHVS01006134.1.p1 GENE.GHVS01006134.1~~GHVS01006134.1.p1  ORF type:complete len:311 (-),score=46.00 GHVS01006134.1:103-939(-)